MLLAALASAPGVLGHTVFTNFYVDGVSQVCTTMTGNRSLLIKIG